MAKFEGFGVPLLLKSDCQEKWVTDAMEEFVAKFYAYDFAGHLVKDDYNEGENEVGFDTIDIIAEEDASDESEQNESGNENDGKDIRLDSNSDIPIVVISDSI